MDIKRKDNMIRLKERGYSYEAIGKLYGVSRQRVHQLISGYNKNHHSLQHKKGWYRYICNSTKERDGNRCQKCGSSKRLIIHHIDGNDTNNDFYNLITLCNRCHLDLHREAGWDIRRNRNNKIIWNDNKTPLIAPFLKAQRAWKRLFDKLRGWVRK